MSSVLTWAALAWLTLLLFGWGVALRKALRTSAETPWKVGPEDAGPEGEARVVAVVPVCRMVPLVLAFPRRPAACGQHLLHAL